MENSYFFREDEINSDSVSAVQENIEEMTWIVNTLEDPVHVEVMPEQYY